MSKKNILIVDDEIEVENSWKTRLEAVPDINEHFEVSCIKSEDFQRLMKGLEMRRRKVRPDYELKEEEDDDNTLDNVDILIVDYDLLKFNQTAYVTGEGFAYLARCYSRCGIIITLNQFGTNKFDLTLKGNLGSFADLNIGSEQMNNIALWGRNRTKFRPWSWEILPDFCDRYEATVNALMGKNDGETLNLDQPILKFFNIPDDISAYLPPSVKTFLGDKNISTVTFRSFVLESDNGLRRKDHPIDDLQVARIAASRIHKWLERRLLAGQDFLVDAPHLALRFPSLIIGNLTNIESWNATTCLGDYSDCAIKYEMISKFQFPYREWLSRPAWFWKSVRECEDIEEVNDPWGTSQEYPDYVFAEDISAFILREGAKEFYADLPSSFVQRYVVDLDSDLGKEYTDELHNIDYEPQLRFAL